MLRYVVQMGGEQATFNREKGIISQSIVIQMETVMRDFSQTSWSEVDEPPLK